MSSITREAAAGRTKKSGTKSGTKTRAPTFRVTGLDGVRAIAVLLVILYHLSPGAVIGGYIGVDLFFVVSGFLITTLLLREREATGHISLSGFWRRRARRLLPALGLLILVVLHRRLCASAGTCLLGLGAQVLGALTFSSNWLFLAAQSDYFSATAPELFRNLWSLAVEEQFYLLWPLLLVLVLLRITRRRADHADLSHRGRPPPSRWPCSGPRRTATRVYYGTDTHAFGLAIGAVLAVVALHWPARPLEWVRWHRMALGIAGSVALAGILAIGVLMPEDSPIVFQGGLVVVAAA